MSFQLFCSGCGAPSSPSVGVCPFCKSVQSNSRGDDHPTLVRIRELFEQGNLEDALANAAAAEKESAKFAADAGFLITYAKILIEAEGPSSKIRALLTKAQLAKPEMAEAVEYLQIIEAKAKLTRDPNDIGERSLRQALMRAPKNPHALFTLASHMYWVENQPDEALRLLQRCVELRPNFLRAWACLAAIHSKRGDVVPAQNALQKVLKLEKNPAMHAYFEKMLAKAAA